MSKSLIIIVVLLGLAAFVSSQEEANNTTTVEPEVLEEWKRWRATYKRFYVDGQDEDNRLKIFKENLEEIKKLQGEERSYKIGLTKFADLSRDEFTNRYLGTRAPALRQNNEQILQASAPASIDWRSKMAVTPIKNQGTCGSCWSFAAVGALEGLYAIKTGVLKTFSEQQLVDCAGSYGTYACNGGTLTAAFKYTRDYGVILGTSYPYKGVKGTCGYKVANAVFRNTGWVAVPKNDQVQLAAAVAQGPVASAVQADASVFQFYTGGIIDGTACGTAVNHAVLIVGYGTENGKDFWLVKNSWGTGWGEGGYVRIAKTSTTGNPGVCGIAVMPSYPLP
jgi:C1A family cysteine protease